MFQAKCVLFGAQKVHVGPGLLNNLLCLFMKHLKQDNLSALLVNKYSKLRELSLN